MDGERNRTNTKTFGHLKRDPSGMDSFEERPQSLVAQCASAKA